MAVTEGVGFNRNDRKGGNQLEFIDVRRAYFHARARRRVYVKLPEEDYEESNSGKLIKAMYGTHDAAQNWECESVEFMEGIQIRRGQPTPCIFWFRENIQETCEAKIQRKAWARQSRRQERDTSQSNVYLDGGGKQV